MNRWIADLVKLALRNEPAVLVTVATVRGSAPREVGAKMLVTATETIGTIGGGRLEYQCSRIACEQIRDAAVGRNTLLRRFVLGANCGQCCGGVVEMMFEQIPSSGPAWLADLVDVRGQRTAAVLATSTGTAHAKFLLSNAGCAAFGVDTICPQPVIAAATRMLADLQPAATVGDFLLEPIRPSAFNIAVFGAGHVGTATVEVLSRLDCNIRWVDSRRNCFPETLPANVQPIESGEPGREVLAMPAGSLFLVMTHSHPVDLEICMRVLQRDDFAYCGLIGSLSKRRRFERLMKKQGLSEQRLERLVCPFGIAGVGGRQPAEIAIAVAAEALQVRDAALNIESVSDKRQGRIHAL